MTGKIIRNSLIVGLGVLGLSVLLFLGMLYRYFGDQIFDEMAVQAALVSQGVEQAGAAYLDDLRVEDRITWVAADGTVLYDNRADAAQMENHAGREEIREAMENRTGTARRYSATLSQATLYYSRRLSDGSVIRIASDQYTVPVLLVSMIQPILIIAALCVLLSAVLATRLTRGIVRPVVELDLEHPENAKVYDELAPLLERLRRQNETIQRQVAQLRRSQEEFTAITENMSEGFLLLDGQGRVLSHNRAALELLQAPQGEDGRNYLLLNREKNFREAVEGALQGVAREAELTTAGRCCQVLANPAFRDGGVAGAVVVLLDVTERAQREELRREFTANVSHELKTPLTSISGIAEIMKSGMVSPEDVPGFAGDIYREAQRMIALVEDILRLSRLDEGEGSEQREQVALYDLSCQIVSNLSAAARLAQVEVRVEGDEVLVDGVPRILGELIYNLCDNAIKYNRPGGHVWITTEGGSGGAVLTVRDDGIGIPREDQGRVFERFYRVDKSHSREIGGTGLGLSIVKHAAAFHNAALELESTPGAGTAIRVRFPAAEQPEE